MNCMDCTAIDRPRPAVAICHDCGAGVCLDHAHVEPRWLTRTAAINRVLRIEPPARLVLCPVCEAARNAAVGGTGETRRRSSAVTT